MARSEHDQAALLLPARHLKCLPVPLRISVLGSFAVSDGNKDLTLSEGSQRLLAFLAINPRPLSRVLVAGTLWPLSTEAHAYSSLRSALARLEDARSGILVTPATLCIADGVSVDLRGARALAHRLLVPGAKVSALNSIEGDLASLSEDLLPGWYEDWATAEYEEWRQLRLHALEAMARILTAAGAYGVAALAALSAVRADPLRESPRVALIKVHLAEGNQSEATREFRRYRVLLAAELHVEPTTLLRDLVTNPVTQASRSPVQSGRRTSNTALNGSRQGEIHVKPPAEPAPNGVADERSRFDAHSSRPSVPGVRCH